MDVKFVLCLLLIFVAAYTQREYEMKVLETARYEMYLLSICSVGPRSSENVIRIEKRPYEMQPKLF